MRKGCFKYFSDYFFKKVNGEEEERDWTLKHCVACRHKKAFLGCKRFELICNRESRAKNSYPSNT